MVGERVNVGNNSYFCGVLIRKQVKRKISQYIREHQLFTSKDKLLVALSGGADSVALLRVLADLGYVCEAAHCNFQLRGEESDRDEAFARCLCEKMGVRLHVERFNTKSYARETGQSVEMAARTLRYEWFERVRTCCGASYIAVAHHRDDSVETFFLNLLRGTGLRGLQGIRPQNGKLVRPMLCVDRKEILDYLNTLGQDYVTDSTNLEDEYRRNRIRHSLVPLLQELEPAARESILRTMEHVGEAVRIYEAAIAEGKRKVLDRNGRISLHKLQKQISPSALLFELLHEEGFNERQVKDVERSIREGQPGTVFLSKTGTRLLRTREDLIIERKDNQEETEPPHLRVERRKWTAEDTVSRDPAVLTVDASKLRGALSLRQVQEGDWFVPFGMNGRKLVSDFLTDKHMNRWDRERQWVLCDGENRVVWLVGMRSDNRFRVDNHTEEVVIAQIVGSKETENKDCWLKKNDISF